VNREPVKAVNFAYAAAREAFAFRHRHEQGILRLTGHDRLAWLNGLVTNDVLSGRRAYTAWLTPQGRMITDMFVVDRDDDTLLEVPAPLAAALAQRLDGLIFTEEARVADVSADVLPLEVCGRGAEFGLDAVNRSLNASVLISVRHVDRPVSGAVLYVPRTLWAGALEALTHAGAMALDDRTAEVLRVEAGIPRFLVDMNEETIPLEAGLDHAISHTKGCYVGQEIIVRIRDRAQGRVARHLVGLRFDGDSVPAAAQPVLFEGRQVGRLTSAVRSIALERPIGLATIHRDASAPDTMVTLSDGTSATVAALPFVPPPHDVDGT
jgi:folate-binding protein YgfZ